MEIPRGRGVSKAKIFKGMYEAKLEIPGRWRGSNKKNLPWERYGYFLEPNNLLLHVVSSLLLKHELYLLY